MRIGPSLGVMVACGFGSLNVLAGTVRSDPPLLFGAGPHVPRAPISIDPALPTGPDFAATLERPRGASAACSARVPVCVQRTPNVPGPDALRALGALETAYQRLVFALRLPEPLADDGHGGGDALDWYLDPERPELATERDALGSGSFDRAAAFCVSAASEDDWLLARDATLCVGEAIAKRLAVGESAALQRAFATELWWITGRVTTLDVQAVDDAQAHPERALAGRTSAASAGAALLLDFLERARSAQASAGLSASLFAAAADTTPPGAWQWNDEPDVFDVLRHSLDEDSAKVSALFGQYSVSRAFLGDRDDGTHAPFGAWLGAFGRPHYDWVIKFSSLPRRVRAARPIEPTGVEMVWVDMDEVPLGVSLGFESEWEAPIAFRWTLISLDVQGQEMARVDVPFQERGRSSEGRVVNLTGVRAVLAIGVNMGGVDLTHPFDPDLDPFEAQSCTLYFARM
ncbi:MAG: hypothetical protein ABJB12_06420 [Pseudomonadota bacterium]